MYDDILRVFAKLFRKKLYIQKNILFYAHLFANYINTFNITTIVAANVLQCRHTWVRFKLNFYACFAVGTMTHDIDKFRATSHVCKYFLNFFALITNNVVHLGGPVRISDFDKMAALTIAIAHIRHCYI